MGGTVRFKLCPDCAGRQSKCPTLFNSCCSLLLLTRLVNTYSSVLQHALCVSKRNKMTVGRRPPTPPPHPTPTTTTTHTHTCTRTEREKRERENDSFRIEKLKCLSFQRILPKCVSFSLLTKSAYESTDTFTVLILWNWGTRWCDSFLLTQANRYVFLPGFFHFSGIILRWSDRM